MPVTQLEQSNELKAVKSPLLFVKKKKRDEQQQKPKKRKEIEDAKLLLCR